MDKVVHFEIPTEKLERAKKFYSDVFGWRMNPVPEMNYVIVHTAEVDKQNMPKTVGAINGGMMNKMEHITGPVITIDVENIDKKVEKIKKAGGKLVMDKMRVGEMGYAAYVKDTEGNVIGLWQTTK